MFYLCSVYINKRDGLTSSSELLKTRFRSLGKSLLITFLLTFVLEILLLMLLVIPYIIFNVYWIFYPFVIADKNLSGMKALSYSKQLVKGKWLKVACIWMLPFLFSLLLVLPVAMITLHSNNFIRNVYGYSVVNLIFLFFFQVIFIMYLNLDAIKSQVKVETATVQ